MTIRTALFPPANRTAALVAFLRTFWQTVRAVGGLTVIGGGAIVVNHVAAIDWPTIGYAALGVIASGLIAGAISGGDILANGLPAAYVDTVTAAGTLPGATSSKHSTDTPGASPAPAVPALNVNATYPVARQTAPTVSEPTPTVAPYPIARPDPTVLESALPVLPVPTTLWPVPTTYTPPTIGP